MRPLIAPLLSATLVLAACQAPDATTPAAAPPVAEAPPAAVPSPRTLPTSDDPRTVLAGTTWRVAPADAADAGATYAFHPDGTLVVDSPHGTPMTGAWAVDGAGALSMTEEGIRYPVDLVVHDADHITLRSHNPGGVAEIVLERAAGRPLPAR